MRIVQLSDSHLSIDQPTRAAELDACISAINAMRPQPDVVVHTGDVAHDGLAEEYALARQLMDGLKAPYVVLAGNRDDRRKLIDAFADGRHLRSDSQFVQYAVDDFDLRLIMLDTMTETSNRGHLCADRLQHAERMMMADPSKPTVIFAHHPPFRVDVGPQPWNFEAWSDAEALLAISRRLDECRGLFCGHVHRSFETAIGPVKACVVSSVASDLRWDEPNGPDSDLPVFKVHSLPGSLL